MTIHFPLPLDLFSKSLLSFIIFSFPLNCLSECWNSQFSNRFPLAFPSFTYADFLLFNLGFPLEKKISFFSKVLLIPRLRLFLLHNYSFPFSILSSPHSWRPRVPPKGYVAFPSPILLLLIINQSITDFSLYYPPLSPQYLLYFS